MGNFSRRKHSVAKEVLTDRSSPEVLKPLDPGRSLRKRLVHIVLIVALGLLAYSNTFYGPFQFDDKPQIIDNPVIKDLKNFTKGYDYNTQRFIGYLSFALNYHFGGFDVISYHIVNLIIHIANALLVYFFILLTFRTPSMLQSTDSSPPEPVLTALFSALLFVSHPLQTQAVTYIIQRFASLAAFFYLLSLVMYIKGRLASRPTGTLLFSLLSAVLAMKTKEIAFTLPLVILLYEFIFFKAPLKKRLLFLLPVLLTLIIVPLSLLYSDKPLGEILLDVSEKTKVQTAMSRWEYLITEMRVIITYIRLIFLPINQNLDYDYPAYHSLFTSSVFLSFVFLLSILGLGVYLLYKAHRAELKAQSEDALKSKSHALCAMPYTSYRLIGFGILWFFITLSVESSIIPIMDVIFEHRLYLPLAGVSIGITTGVLLAAKRLKIEKIVMPVIVLITLLLSGLTYARNTLWNDEISLWQDAAKKSLNKDRPHNHLGNAYASQNQLDRAIAEYQTALQLKPDYAEAHNNLGVAYASQGQLDWAIADFQTALQLEPDYAEAHSNLGNAYTAQGQLDKAIAEYQTALRLKPDFAEAHSNLGNAYTFQGQFDEAIAEYQTALRLKPDYAKVHDNLGIVYAAQGQLDRAIAEFQTALRLKPDFYEALQHLNEIISRQQ